MAKTVFVTDLDGTFMRDDKTISKYSIDLCNRKIPKQRNADNKGN